MKTFEKLKCFRLFIVIILFASAKSVIIPIPESVKTIAKALEIINLGIPGINKHIENSLSIPCISTQVFEKLSKEDKFATCLILIKDYYDYFLRYYEPNDRLCSGSSNGKASVKKILDNFNEVTCTCRNLYYGPTCSLNKSEYDYFLAYSKEIYNWTNNFYNEQLLVSLEETIGLMNLTYINFYICSKLSKEDSKFGCYPMWEKINKLLLSATKANKVAFCIFAGDFINDIIYVSYLSSFFPYQLDLEGLVANSDCKIGSIGNIVTKSVESTGDSDLTIDANEKNFRSLLIETDRVLTSKANKLNTISTFYQKTTNLPVVKIPAICIKELSSKVKFNLVVNKEPIIYTRSGVPPINTFIVTLLAFDEKGNNLNFPENTKCKFTINYSFAYKNTISQPLSKENCKVFILVRNEHKWINTPGSLEYGNSSPSNLIMEGLNALGTTFVSCKDARLLIFSQYLKSFSGVFLFLTLFTLF